MLLNKVIKIFVILIMLGQFSVHAEQILYTNDFNGPNFNESIENARQAEESFLGCYRNDVVKLNIDSLPGPGVVNITLDLYIIDSWDGNADQAEEGEPHPPGPDIWAMQTDEPDEIFLLHSTFGQWNGYTEESGQSYPHRYPIEPRIDFICPFSVNDEIINAELFQCLGTDINALGVGDTSTTYRINETINHVDSESLTLVFYGKTEDSTYHDIPNEFNMGSNSNSKYLCSDEVWGMDNMTVTYKPCQEGDTWTGTSSDDAIDSPVACAYKTYFGEHGNDVIKGDNTDNVIYGKEGNDLLYGRGGNDEIYGGNGIDKIYGMRGNNLLNGGEGKDYIICGSGFDNIIMDLPTEIETETDFSDSRDRIINFTPGVNGDLLDLSSLMKITNYKDGHPFSLGYIRLVPGTTTQGTELISVRIDPDGKGNILTAIPVAYLINIDIEDLNNNENFKWK